MQFIQIAKIILQLLPLIIAAVKAIEEAIPDSNQGSMKLALVREAIESAYKIGSDAMISFEQMWPAIESTVSSVVKLFNSTGVFKK